ISVLLIATVRSVSQSERAGPLASARSPREPLSLNVSMAALMNSHFSVQILLDAENDAGGLEGRTGVFTGPELQGFDAFVGDDGGQHAAAGELELDFGVDRTLGDPGDAAAEDVAGAHLDLVQLLADDHPVGLDDGKG